MLSFLSPDWIRERFGHEGVSDELLGLLYGLAASSILFLAVALYGAFDWEGFLLYLVVPFFTLTGAGMGLLAMKMYAEQLEILAVPPQAAMLKIWGRRILVVFKEQVLTLFPWWPLKIEVDVIDASPQEFDFPFTNIDCGGGIGKSKEAGGAVNGTISGTYVPNTNDPAEFHKYLDHEGGPHQIRTVLMNVHEEAFSSAAREFGWEEFTGLEKPVKALLLANTSKVDFKKLREPGNPIPREARDMTPGQYAAIPESATVPDLLHYLFREKVDEVERQCRFREAEVFVNVHHQDKLSDDKNLGILITRLNVVIRGVPELQDEANKTAAEDTQRRREFKNDKTKRTRALLHIRAARAAGSPIPYSEAIQRVAIEDQLAQEIIVRGSGNALLDAAAAHGAVNPK